MDASQLHILIVDDDRGVRDGLVEIFSDEGFPVTAIADGPGALALIGTRDFSLVVMDVRLGTGQDGREIMQRARAARPALKALYISGATAGLAFDPDLDGFVSKPFRPREIVGCVWELLCREPRRRQAETIAAGAR
jgi:two-component system OmpR family response regulator